MHAGQDSWLGHITSPSGVLFGGSVFLYPRKKQLGFPLSCCRADPRLIGVGTVVTLSCCSLLRVNIQIQN